MAIGEGGEVMWALNCWTFGNLVVTLSCTGFQLPLWLAYSPPFCG